MSRGHGVLDPRAIVDPTASLGENVTVGAWSVIGEGVQIGANSVIGPHVVVQAGTQIAENCRIGPFSVLGAHPLAPAFLDELSLDAPLADGTPVLEPLSLGAGVLVHAQSRVISSVPPGEVVAGSPAVRVAASQVS